MNALANDLWVVNFSGEMMNPARQKISVPQMYNHAKTPAEKQGTTN